MNYLSAGTAYRFLTIPQEASENSKVPETMGGQPWVWVLLPRASVTTLDHSKKAAPRLETATGPWPFC